MYRVHGFVCVLSDDLFSATVLAVPVGLVGALVAGVELRVEAVLAPEVEAQVVPAGARRLALGALQLTSASSQT